VSVVVNMLPAVLIRESAARSRRRRWWTAAVVTGVCGLGATLAVRAVVGSEDERIRDRLIAVSGEHHAAVIALESVRGRVRGAQAQLTAARSIVAHPNWSRLLALLSEVRGEEVVLDSIDIRRSAIVGRAGSAASQAASAQSAAAAVLPESYTVLIAGRGSDQREVQAFVLRLEQRGIFAAVRLDRADARRFEDRELTEFQIVCELKERRREREGVDGR
jgi:Fimbrial assembly protein (PilN)